MAREQLVIAYLPMVKFAARRLGIGLPAHVDGADLISYGLLGLIGAIERFEPERGIRFETFAMARIRGSIIDALRSLDWVPRSVRARAREVELAQSKLEQEPSVCSLDEPWALPDLSGDQVSLLDTISDPSAADPQRALDTSEIKDRLAEAIGSLAQREQLVIALYYYENLTLREIGEVLDVTESRVSQLHTKAVMRLKSHLQAA